jgi:hypothetical protein
MGWVQPRGPENSPQISKRLSVDLKCVHCGAPDTGSPNNENIVRAPGEMGTPLIPPQYNGIGRQTHAHSLVPDARFESR